MRTSLFALGIVFLGSLGLAKAQDFIRYRDAEKGERETDCEILSDTPSGVRIRIRNVKDPVEIDPGAVLFLLGRVPTKSFSQLREPLAREELSRKEGTEADKLAQLKLAANGADENLTKTLGTPGSRGWALYLARLRAKLAESEPEQTDQAIALLTRERANLEAGWTVLPSMLLLSSLQQVKGDNEGAQRTLGLLADRPGLSVQSREKVQVSRIRILIRLSKYPEATLQLAKVTDPANKAILQAALSLVQGRKIPSIEATLKPAIAKATDAGLQAMGSNLLGELFLAANQREDAFWEFLRVETIFSLDRAEEAKALYHLATLFDTVRNDPTRANLCREKLKKPYFAGTEHQSMLR